MSDIVSNRDRIQAAVLEALAYQRRYETESRERHYIRPFLTDHDIAERVLWTLAKS